MENQRTVFIDFIILSIAVGANIIALFYQFYFDELPCPLFVAEGKFVFYSFWSSNELEVK